jgi:hypothetical protein
MLSALLRKDLRLMRSVLITSTMSVVLSFGVTAAVSFSIRESVWSGQPAIVVWASVFALSTQLCFLFAYFSVAFLSGSIIASERQDRSAEFLACLPPLRRHTLASKALVCAGFVGVIWGAYACHFAVSEYLEQHTTAVLSARQRIPLGDAVRLLIGCAGIAWAVSSVARSPTIAVLFGLISPLIAMPIVHLALHSLGVSLPLEEMKGFVFNAVLLAGLAGFGTGSTWYLLGREERP